MAKSPSTKDELLDAIRKAKSEVGNRHLSRDTFRRISGLPDCPPQIEVLELSTAIKALSRSEE